MLSVRSCSTKSRSQPAEFAISTAGYWATADPILETSALSARYSSARPLDARWTRPMRRPGFGSANSARPSAPLPISTATADLGTSVTPRPPATH